MRPTEHVYGSAITACLNAEDLPRAFNVLERMTADGISLSTSSHSTSCIAWRVVGLTGTAVTDAQPPLFSPTLSLG